MRVLDIRDRAAVAALAAERVEADVIDGLINNAALQHNLRLDQPRYSVGEIVQYKDTSVRVVDVVLPLVDTPMTAGRGCGKISAAKAAEAIPLPLSRRGDRDESWRRRSCLSGGPRA